MSDRFLVVIPADPATALPETAEGIRSALAAMADGNESRVKDYGKLQFIDAGQNFERITCPACAAEIDAAATWHDWMESDFHGEDGFHLHRHETPCCGMEMTLNELVYHFPQGFARWFVSARNVNRGPLTPDEIMRLEEIAGFKLTAIAQRY
ncbi:MAG: hypothetical protein AAFR73_03795 [Pseudomonadota bacterium]